MSKLVLNTGSLALGVLANSVVPRALGPARFGSFTFLQTFFQSVVAFAEGGSSIYFFTRLSGRPDDRAFLRFYRGVAMAICALVVCFVSISAALGLRGRLWDDEPLYRVCAMAVLALLTWSIDIAMKACDAFALTVSAEILRFSHKALVTLGIVGAALYADVSLDLYIAYLVLASVLLLILLARLIAASAPAPSAGTVEPRREQQLREMWAFCGPIFLYNCVSQIGAALDAWMLRRFAGSEEQGFYGLSLQLGLLAGVFINALVPLVTREFSLAFAEGKHDQAAQLYGRAAKGLFVITAGISGFAYFQADRLASVFGGHEFAGASPAIALMALVPAHQAYGQLTNGLLFAAGKTRVYRNLGIASSFLGLAATYFLVAPRSAGGLALGADGQAIKMVVLQFVMVNIAMILSVRSFGVNFGRLIAHQVGIGSAALAVGWCVRRFGSGSFGAGGGVVIDALRIGADGFLFQGAMIALVFAVPSVAGLKRSDVSSLLRRLRQRRRHD